jgi:hypothetical protein
MPNLMLYGWCLRGYAPYARGLQSHPTEWIIWRITRKRKSANLLSIQSNEWIYISYITHYTCLWHRYIMTPVVYATLVVCPTLIMYLDSGHTSRLRSTSQLRSYLLTLVVHHDSGQWACRMSYHLGYERLHMVMLDDCSILQPRHLVRSRLGGMHDSFSVWNLSISWLCMFECRSCAVWPMDTRPSLIWEKAEYPEGLGTLATRVDQGLRMSGQVSQGSMSHDHGTKNWSHLRKILSSTNRARYRSGSSKALNVLWTQCMTPTVLSTKLETTRWKIQTTRADWWLWLICMTT